MRIGHFFMGFLFAAGLAFSVPASAQDNVSARSATHDGYARIVFEWSEKPAYSLSKQEGRLLIRFAKAAKLDAGEVSAGTNVKKVETLSQAGEPLQVAVEIPAASRFRDFIVQNKLVIDVYDAEGAPPSVAAAEKEPEKKPAPVAPAPKIEDEPKAENPEQTTKPANDFSVSKASDAESAPITPVEKNEVAAPVAGEHIITMTGTFSIGMASFIRGDDLWIVVDSPDSPARPVVNSPDSEDPVPLQRIEIPEGAAYRMKIPAGLHAHGEGGGLSWKIILSPAEKNPAPATPVADASTGKTELVWPLKSMRKILSFEDPVVGDTITVVTAGDAKQFAGPARKFVQLDTLESVIGLAYAAKTEGVKATMNTQQVRVGREGGLAVASASGSAPPPIERVQEQPQEETPAEEKPATDNNLALTEEAPPATTEEAHSEEAPAAVSNIETMAKAAGEKPAGNNIYNFPSWEMGGLQVLRRNQHVMMTDISAKPDEARDGDIITLAKINIANNRGAEALGLLRIALQKVPDLENNTEFQALRAAALALSGKYDEAIEDFSRPALRDYADVKLWRVYTLALLEDWKQAIVEMPADISLLATYPKPLRVPMELTLAEVALRSGKVPVARGMLNVIEKELPTLPLHLSSSWQYLAGEADRQSGKVDEAVKHWEPLVKNGKDDLFRAKAGLSLTKLKLDQKKIKPDEAIDKLETLRYAWRGDELETLINYRLGHLYIENKDYLKGLTVLRNATTLSPGTAIGDEVDQHLKKSFDDIFTNNRLKDVSPLEAISIYEEFKDLTPQGEVGDSYVEKLAERLVEADLLGRASSLLEYHVNNRLKGPRKAEIAIRLAAIRLLDGNPDGALRSLEVAESVLTKPQPAVTPAATDATTPPPAAPAETVLVNDPEKLRQVYLLRARALSMKKKPDEALAILDGMPPDADVNRLKTDVAWTAGKFEEAAAALNDLITAEDISARRPLTDYQRDIIFNRAIALNLSGNRVALSNLRERYNTQMAGTPRGQMFEVVTRPRRPDMIGSREAIESMISEIDLFQGFLDGYTKMNAKPEEKPPVKAEEKPAAKEEVKAEAAAAEPSPAPEAKAAEEAAE